MVSYVEAHAARKHSGTYALELLAAPSSKTLSRAAITALFRIGWRDCAEATTAEWALLNLAELALMLRESADVPPLTGRE